MKVKKQIDSTFTIDQENWIVSQFHQGFSPTQVRPNFNKRYGFSTKSRKLFPHHFSRVFKRFQKNGIATSKLTGGPKKSIQDPKYAGIENFYSENPKASLMDGSKQYW